MKNQAKTKSKESNLRKPTRLDQSPALKATLNYLQMNTTERYKHPPISTRNSHLEKIKPDPNTATEPQQPCQTPVGKNTGFFTTKQASCDGTATMAAM